MSGVTIEVITKDCVALGDAELSDIADMTASGVGWEAGQLGKEAEDWVLACQAFEGGQLKGFMFTTLERIGGTPALVIGPGSMAGDASSTVLKSLMDEQYHRALMAFPDEDVLIAVRLAEAGGLESLDRLSDVQPCPGVKANGEERAWGRRLSKRYGATKFDDRAMVAHADVDCLALDHQPSSQFDASDCFDGTDLGAGDFVIAWGWAMAEFLEGLSR